MNYFELKIVLTVALFNSSEEKISCSENDDSEAMDIDSYTPCKYL